MLGSLKSNQEDHSVFSKMKTSIARSMYTEIKKMFLLFGLICLLASCYNTQNGNKSKAGLTEEQASALDALTELQINTDDPNRFYSTFPGISHPCYPADTSFDISQSQLKVFMELFVKNYGQRIAPEIQNRIVTSSVLAQKKYTILHCSENRKEDYKGGLPMTGTWVIPNVLDRRDVLLVWSY